VSFQSTSTNLVGDDTNHRSDVFVHDLAAGPEAQWALTDLSVNPDRVRAGQRVSVTAYLKNVGEADGSYSAALTLNGAVIGNRTVSLRSGRDARVAFTFRSPAAGTYPLTLGHLTAQLTVRR
jgi:hypothetical protein